VTVNLDEGGGRIDCYVRSVDGPVATLGHLAGIVPLLRRRLSPGSLGYLTFSHNGTQIAVRGVATVDCVREPDLAFVGLDGNMLPERRTDQRVELVTTARVHVVDADGTAMPDPIETLTADLSLGGALIERRPGLVAGSRLHLDLCFGAFPAVHCEAVLARHTSAYVAVKFIEMQEADRLRLAGVLAGQRRRRSG
jgi:hypothetical protein